MSASHNPAEYNGIKFFGGEGRKLRREDEAEIERLLDESSSLPGGTAVGAHHRGSREISRYLRDLVRAPGHSLEGIRVLLDCANGAGFRLAPAAFSDAGAQVTALFDRPDGFNINDGCGSTEPDALRGAMLAGDYDLGISLDGDADRVVAVSPEGRVLDGDDLLYILARDFARRGLLPGGKIVTTVVNNRGLDASLKADRVRVVHCSVGDREIMYAMQREGARLGGETSGHILMEDFSVAGDATLAALMLASVMVRSGRSLAELLEGFTKFPQVIINVPVRDREGLAGDRVISDRIGEVEDRLADDGRVLVRASGTEPVVRVMVECPRAREAKRMASELACLVSERLGITEGGSESEE
ncbi:MAG: phosphoglucosamine mutase [Bacillota bacterium]